MIDESSQGGYLNIPRKKSDATVATEIEVRKTVRAAGRKTKEAVEDTAAKIKEAVDDQALAAEIEVKKATRAAGRKAKEAVDEAIQSDAAVAAEIEVKKAARKAGRKVKEAAKATGAAVAEAKNTAKKATLDIIIESPMGGAITTDEIAKKVPDGANAVYVRVDKNKLYWVKGDETGSVDIWE